MIPFLSCDWGTSSFRLSLVDPENFHVIAAENSDKGILATFNYWKEILKADPAARLIFYRDIIQQHITTIEKKAALSLEGVPIVISGMASSSIGMKPLPYHEMPFSTDGEGMLSEHVAATPEFKHDILLISGASNGEDVMRGEETQLIGIIPPDTGVSGNQLFILPGTHSKHIVVSGKQATSFKTYMTGEFFDLLSKKSILHDGLEKDEEQNPETQRSFELGVRHGAGSNLLNVCFKVRTNALFDKLTKKENYHYLSGLLIGAEVGDIKRNGTIGIYLCCGSHLKVYYERALQVLGLKDNVHSLPAPTVERAALKGQYKIYEKQVKR